MDQEIIRNHQEKIYHVYDQTIKPEIEKPYLMIYEWLDAYIKETERFFNIRGQLTGEKDKIRILQEHIIYRKNMLKMLNSKMPEKPVIGVENVMPDFYKQFDLKLQESSEFWITQQNRDRFTRLKGESNFIAFLKSVKRLGWFFYILPGKTANFFRKLFKKEEKPPRLWKQKIPVQKITSWTYDIGFIKQLTSIADIAWKEAALMIFEIWKCDDSIYDAFRKNLEGDMQKEEFTALWNEQIILQLNAIKEKTRISQENISNDFHDLIKNTDKDFEHLLLKGGTVEFPSFRYRNRLRKKARNNNRKYFSSVLQKRLNTLFALSDDWKFNQEIYFLTTNSIKSGLQFRSRIESRSQVVNDALNELPQVLQNIKKEITDSDVGLLRKKLQQLKHHASKTLHTKLLPEFQKLLLEQDFPLILDESEQNLLSELNNLYSQRTLITDFDPANAYSNKQTEPVSPVVLIEFEMSGKLRKVIRDLKKQTLHEIQQLNNKLEDLARMVVFNFDSAHAMLEEQGELKLKDCLSDARTGMHRALKNQQDITNDFNSFINGLSKEIEQAINEFVNSIRKLRNNKNVEEIRFRLAKAKALKKSEQLLSALSNLGSMTLKKGRGYHRLASRKFVSYLDGIRGQLGIGRLERTISSEISEFLTSSEDNIPFVYKRLFSIEPLRESTFYFQRAREKTKLVTAFQRWQKGAFMPVLVTGEKGSGISTFIHMFVKENIQRKPAVYSVKPAKRILSEEDLLSLLGHSFKGEAFLKQTELYDFIETQEPFVAYVDKLQLMFLRQPGGFNILKKFFEIISSTSKKIFWICTCGLYASLYLDKSIGLYGYFPVLISMKNLSTDEVKKVILLRHNASGYSLFFESSNFDRADRRFVKKNKKEQQLYLEEKFFSKLNNFSESNISFALQLWIKSTLRVEENRIHINSLAGIDFGFMQNLPHEVVFGLHALLIHENLDVFQLSQVLGVSRRQAYLLLMRLADRGIVLEDRGLYSIHPLLYRETIGLLKDKNLIH